MICNFCLTICLWINMWLSNCCPLSESITLGIPNLQTMFFQTNFCILVSVITAKGSCGSGPTMSIPYIENGQREEILARCFAGTCCTFPNRWHLSHLWMTSIASFYMVSQKYLARITFPTNDRGLEWLPHTPSWTSCNTYIASSKLRHFR